MHKPLRGVRVLDLTNVLAGPFACHQLALMGAEVIKVETPKGGDLARQLGGDPELIRKSMGVAFLAQNSGKRSITLNLKNARGKEAFHKLVATADVLVENFRPGVMQRLGLGYEALLAHRPRLIYCAISGFGQDGPLRDFPAYDQIIQGMSGVMSVTGSRESAPLRVGYPVADTIGGVTAAFAVSAALADRGREGGCFIDVSLLESCLATMGWAVANYLVAGQEPLPMGNDNVTGSPSGTFRTGDGLINIAANKQEQWEEVARVAGMPELISDPRFVDRLARLRNRQELTRILEGAFAAKTTDEWWKLLNAASVPAGPVYTVPQALAQPQVRDRGLIGEFKDVRGVGRDVRMVRAGFKVDGEAPSTALPPPQLGQHTEEILAELGYDADAIRALRRDQAI